MNLSSVYRKSGDAVTRQIAGETLIVPIRSRLADMQKIFAVNGVADYIWQQLDGERSLKEIHRGILDDFEVEAERAGSDILEFVSQLQEAGIIEEVA